MPFLRVRDAELRLIEDTSPLTAEEVRDLMPWMNVLGTGAVRRLETELALQTIQAVESLNRSSRKPSSWIIVLTVVLVVLTSAITYFTILLTRMPRG